MARDKALDRILKEMSATDREAFMEQGSGSHTQGDERDR